MTTGKQRPLHRVLAATAALALLALSGCVAYPGYGYPGYAYGPAYGPGYVYAPPVAVGIGLGCCWGHGGWGGRGWR
jgi:hypothetical protein